MAAALLLALCTVPSGGAGAQTLCTEPVAPTCVQTETTYEEQAAQKRCRQQVTDYQEEMLSFERCLEQSQDRARQERRELAARFACRVEGGGDCPGLPGREGSVSFD